MLRTFLVPIIIRSDKTTVSVTTRQTEYWLVYISIGNISNNMGHAYQNGLMLLGFLACPKSKFALLLLLFLTLISTSSKGNNANWDDPMFCNFHQQLIHSLLVKMLESVKPGMTTMEVVCCSDDHFF